MMTKLGRWSCERTPWLLLAGSALGLELSALYFQYVQKLDPCVLCIYERVAIIAILAAGLSVAVAPRLTPLRWLGLALWGVGAAWGLMLALEHVGIQFGSALEMTCTFTAEFPAWAKLDEWLPSVFQPTGLCDEIQWLFAGLTMPQWMVVIFAVYLLILAAVVASQFLPGRQGVAQ